MPVVTGVVPLEGRGDLPFLHLHREPLFVHCVRTLLRTTEVDEIVVTVDPGQHARAHGELARHRLRAHVEEDTSWWSTFAARETSVVVMLDPLCPLVPARFVAALLTRAAGVESRALAAFRPVTDTIKTVVDHQIADTINRDDFAIITSPVVVPAGLLAGDPPPSGDFAVLVGWLRRRGGVDLVKAPSMGRRVDDESAVSVLECVDEIGRAVQES